MIKKIIVSTLLISQLAPAVCPQQGPNRFQSSPVLTSATYSNGVLTVIGSLSTFRRCATYLIQFFGNPANRNPLTEGADFLGQLTVTTNNLGTATFTFMVTAPISDGFVSATATVINCDGSKGDTSMFSPNIVIS